MRHASLVMRLSLARPAVRQVAVYCQPRNRDCYRRRWLSSAPADAGEPLRILFCGSDDFSCASLQALHAEMQQQHKDHQPGQPGHIASLDVVVRPAKRTGRGFKTIIESPVKLMAASLGLRVHERDTFTGWQPPDPFNMIVAVSFGLFVPPRLLRAARYGGLNVHPSLLPDLYGAAPIEHAILAGRTRTGVTVQTLDERTFDGGRILLQGPEDGGQKTGVGLGLEIPPRATAADLRATLAPLGAGLLVQVLRRGLYRPGLICAAPADSPLPLLPACKLTKADRQVPWRAAAAAAAAVTSMGTAPISTAEAVDRRARALGPLWTRVVRPAKADETTGPLTRKRVILEGVECVACPPALQAALVVTGVAGQERVPAVTFAQQNEDGSEVEVVLPVVAVDGDAIVLPAGMDHETISSSSSSSSSSSTCLLIRTAKVEGDRSKPAARALGAFLHSVAGDHISWDVAGGGPIPVSPVPAAS